MGHDKVFQTGLPNLHSGNVWIGENATVQQIEACQWLAMKLLTEENNFVLPPRASAVNPKATIEAPFGRWMQRDGKYLKPLPIELVRWYYYIEGQGHNIVAIPQNGLGPDSGGPLLLPFPVRLVQRKYRIVNGFVMIDVSYFLTEEHDFSRDRKL